MIYVSTSAWEYLQSAIGDNYGIKVSLKANGCSGFGIKTELAPDGIKKNEYCFFVGHPSDLTTTLLHVIVNEDELDRFEGMSILLEEEGLNKKVKYNLANTGNSCGCGESFSFAT